jgi:alpha-1,3-mannosyltransferase
MLCENIMKILHISRRFYPSIGGTERYIYEISRRLIARNHECRVLTIDRDIIDGCFKDLPPKDIVDGIEVVRINAFGSYKKPIPVSWQRIIESLKWADIVHIHDMRMLYETALFMKHILRYKLFLSTHGFIFHTKWRRYLKDILFRFYYLPTIKIFDCVIAVSLQDADLLAKAGLNNMEVLENGIDFQKFSSAGRMPVRGSLFYFGRIDKNKGLEGLFNCLSLIKDKTWVLNIAGSGSPDYISTLRKMTIQRGISERIIWHGYAGDEALLDMLARSHLCIFPSSYEGFGLTLLEAMAAGVVCVASDIPAYARMLSPGHSGFLTDFNDISASSHLISKLLEEDMDRFNDICENARGFAKGYDWILKIDRLISLYRAEK